MDIYLLCLLLTLMSGTYGRPYPFHPKEIQRGSLAVPRPEGAIDEVLHLGKVSNNYPKKNTSLKVFTQILAEAMKAMLGSLVDAFIKGFESLAPLMIEGFHEFSEDNGPNKPIANRVVKSRHKEQEDTKQFKVTTEKLADIVRRGAKKIKLALEEGSEIALTSVITGGRLIMDGVRELEEAGKKSMLKTAESIDAVLNETAKEIENVLNKTSKEMVQVSKMPPENVLRGHVFKKKSKTLTFEMPEELDDDSVSEEDTPNHLAFESSAEDEASDEITEDSKEYDDNERKNAHESLEVNKTEDAKDKLAEYDRNHYQDEDKSETNITNKEIDNGGHELKIASEESKIEKYAAQKKSEEILDELSEDEKKMIEDIENEQDWMDQIDEETLENQSEDFMENENEETKKDAEEIKSPMEATVGESLVGNETEIHKKETVEKLSIDQETQTEDNIEDKIKNVETEADGAEDTSKVNYDPEDEERDTYNEGPKVIKTRESGIDVTDTANYININENPIIFVKDESEDHPMKRSMRKAVRSVLKGGVKKVEEFAREATDAGAKLLSAWIDLAGHGHPEFIFKRFLELNE